MSARWDYNDIPKMNANELGTSCARTALPALCRGRSTLLTTSSAVTTVAELSLPLASFLLLLLVFLSYLFLLSISFEVPRLSLRLIRSSSSAPDSVLKLYEVVLYASSSLLLAGTVRVASLIASVVSEHSALQLLQMRLDLMRSSTRSMSACCYCPESL